MEEGVEKRETGLKSPSWGLRIEIAFSNWREEKNMSP